MDDKLQDEIADRDETIEELRFKLEAQSREIEQLETIAGKQADIIRDLHRSYGCSNGEYLYLYVRRKMNVTREVKPGKFEEKEEWVVRSIKIQVGVWGDFSVAVRPGTGVPYITPKGRAEGMQYAYEQWTGGEVQFSDDAIDRSLQGADLYKPQIKISGSVMDSKLLMKALQGNNDE